MFALPAADTPPSILTAHSFPRLILLSFHLFFQISKTQKVLETKCPRMRPPRYLLPLHRKEVIQGKWNVSDGNDRGTFAPDFPATTCLVMPEFPSLGDQNTTATTLRKPACPSGNHVLTALFPSRGLFYSSVPPSKSFAARLETIHPTGDLPSGRLFFPRVKRVDHHTD